MKLTTRRFMAASALVLTLGLAAGCANSVAAPTGSGSTAPADSTSKTPQPTDRASQTPSSRPTQSTPAPEPTASATPSASTQSPSPTPSPTPTKAPAMLKSGDSGDKVRELNHRLTQLEWLAGKISPEYSAATAEAVRGFQAKRGLQQTGEVDQTTWNKLVSMTKTPTHDEMYNILKAGPALYKKGDSGEMVKQIQARLKQLDWFSPLISGTYGDATVEGVKGFQGKRGFPVTGEIDQRTWDMLVSMTRTPTTEELNNKPPKQQSSNNPLDPRCMTGRVLCINKDTNTLVWVVDGKAVLTLDVRFGSDQTPTREGVFSVYWKSRDHVSTIYHTAMPYAMFFSGGQAVHYSADFAARGYNGASHGCVNVRDKASIIWLFDQVRNGDKVVVYRA